MPNALGKKKIDMTEGPIFGKILVFILPLVATNLLQMCYNAADMMVVGLSSENDAVGAIGTTGAMINLIINIVFGFSVGANVVVARNIGSKNDAATSRAVHNSIIISVLFGLLSTAVGLIFSESILIAMGNRGKLLELATLYTRIYFIGVPFVALTNYSIAILRAKGDTRTPLFVLMGTGLLNVCMNLLFVLVLDMSVDGVAWATVISNAVSAILLLLVLARDEGACKFSLHKLRFDKEAFWSIIKIGLPAGVQGALFSLSNMLIQSSLLQVNNALCAPDSAYQPVIKGSSAASNLEGFAYTATNSVYQAAISFTSQNVGAKKYKRIGRVMRNCYAVTFAIAAFAGAILLLLKTPLLSMYGVVTGAEGTLEKIAYDTATTRMLIMMIPYFTLAFMEVGSGVLRGLGKSLLSTVISLVGSCVLRVVWIYTVFQANPTIESIYVSYPISWTLTALTHFTVAMLVKRRLINRETATEEAKQET